MVCRRVAALLILALIDDGLLQIHGETVRRHPALQAKAKALLELQSSVWRRVDNMFQNTRCLVTFLSNLQF